MRAAGRPFNSATIKAMIDGPMPGARGGSKMTTIGKPLLRWPQLRRRRAREPSASVRSPEERGAPVPARMEETSGGG